ncbi:right-handed parallel beta-helix repeat-containing protein [Flexithrix dorotheae]|uniref:right-handed parallel beta-helix repeat-containing protein n=1 Tax=Flexithrix dorotheae TaxID=70993 RepID=UPI00038208DE|nr:right-handed parallel beta-helix repeat-containing protein [Flexithrix dorotheae]
MKAIFNIKKSLLILLLFYSQILFSQDHIYVNQSNNIQGTGTLKNPFNTIDKAIEWVKFNKNSIKGDLTIYIKEGHYFINKPIHINSSHNLPNGILSLEAFPGDRPVISGGIPVNGWKKHEKGIYKATVPISNFRQLYFKDQKAIRARTPNPCAFFRIVDWDENIKKIIVNEPDVANVKFLSDNNPTEMFVQKHWGLQIYRLNEIENNWGTIYVTPFDREREETFKFDFPQRSGNVSYHFENNYQFMDQANEWYFDKTTHTLYFLPEFDQTDSLENNFIIPATDTLLSIIGSLEEPVNNLSIKGLTFSHSNWNLPTEIGFVTSQASNYTKYGKNQPSNGAIFVKDTRKLVLEGNTLKNLGGSGIIFHSGVRESKILANQIEEIASNGIVIDWDLEKMDINGIYSGNVLVKNNFITKVGSDYKSGVGVFVGYADSVTIENNYIFNVPYSAISVGWGWTSDDTNLKDNIIRNNRIENAVTLLSDGAGIYTLSKQPGTKIYGNLIKNVNKSEWSVGGLEGWPVAGIYLDERSDLISVYDNLIINADQDYHFSPSLGENNILSLFTTNSGDILKSSGLEKEYKFLSQGKLIIDNCPFSFDEAHQFEIFPFPNPVKEDVTIIYNFPHNNEKIICEFFDLNGAKVLENVFDFSFLGYIKLSNLPLKNGMYIVRLSTGKDYGITKLIKV